MDNWMLDALDRRMVGLKVNGWTDDQTENGRLASQTEIWWTDGWSDRKWNVWTKGWMNGRTVGWMYKWMIGLMDGRMVRR